MEAKWRHPHTAPRDGTKIIILWFDDEYASVRYCTTGCDFDGNEIGYWTDGSAFSWVTDRNNFVWMPIPEIDEEVLDNLEY